MNGDFFSSDRDIVVEGPQALAYTRYYDSGDHSNDFFYHNHYGYGVSLGYPLVLKFYDLGKKRNITVDQRQRFPVPFTLNKEKTGLKGYFDKKMFKSGYTNCTEALQNGEPSLAHTEVIFGPDGSRYDKAWNVCFADGSKRVYLYACPDYLPQMYRNLLVREDHPNGLSTHYEYEPHLSSVRLSKISLKNSIDQEELSSIEIKHSNPNDYTVTGSNGQSASYHRIIKSGDIRGSHGKISFTSYFLTQASGAHLLSTENEYPIGERMSTIFKLGKINGADGRYLQAKYDSKCRVEELLSPLGTDATPKCFYAFKYDKNLTRVTNAIGRVDTYHFADKRLHAKEEGGARSHVYDWDDRGQLVAKSLLDKKNVLEAVIFKYNDKGNIIEKKECGNITGSGAEIFSLRRGGLIIGTPDQRIHTYRYGERCLLLEEKDENGVSTLYGYKPGTNLMTVKLTVSEDVIHERQFSCYDKNAILIKTIDDDGSTNNPENISDVTYRLITRIQPQMNKALHGFTKPKVKEEFYLDIATGQEMLLKRIEMNYTAGGLLSEVRVYDAMGDFAYSEFYSYDDHFLLKQHTDTIGHTTEYRYDANHNLIFEELQGSGKQIHRSYDLSNRLIEEKEVHEDGTILTVTHTYDLVGNCLSTTDTEGFTTKFFYDKFDRLVKEIDPYGVESFTEYDLKDNPIKIIDKENNITLTTYTIDHQPIKILYPDGTSESFAYFIDGSLKTKREKDGSSIGYTYDYEGRILTETRYDQQSSPISRKTNVYKGKNLIAEIDVLGITTTYSYDGGGRVISKTREGITETYSYDALGRLSETTKGDRVQIQFFDCLDRVVEERNEDLSGNVYRKSTIAYDIYGNPSKKCTYTSLDKAIETSTHYNSFNLPYLSTDGQGETTTFTYTHHPYTKTTVDPLGKITIERYDAFKRITMIEVPTLSKQEIVYSAKGNKIQQINHIFRDGQDQGLYVIHWTYDAMGNVLSLIEQGQKETRYVYKYGRLDTTSKPDGILLYHQYDAFGRVAEQTSSDGALSISYTYDLAGNLLSAYDQVNHRLVVRTYDAENNVTSETTHITLKYSYDELGRLTEIIFPDSVISYTYSPTDLIAVSRCGQNHTYSYDLAGRIVQENTFEGFAISYTYNDNSQVTSIISPYYTQALFYDATKKLVSTTIDDKTISYIYDGLYQLIAENTTTYSYDSLYNRLTKNNSTYQHNTLHQVLSDEEHVYTYDPNGNRLTKNGLDYTYDPLNRLTSSGSILYTYDPLGRLYTRTSPTSQETFFYYKEFELGSPQFLKILGRGILAIEHNKELYTTICDHRGSPTAIIKNYVPVASYFYSAFGETTHTGSFDIPWQYCGHRRDPDTQLLHAPKRIYDPALGCWLTPDPLGFADGPNLYAYVHNNPLTHIDPTGLFATFSSFRSGLNSGIQGFQNGCRALGRGLQFANNACQWADHAFTSTSNSYHQIKENTQDMGNGFARGFADDTTWGASEYALGSFQAKSAYGNFGYYAGTGVSLAVGMYYGATEAKILKGLGNYAFKKGSQYAGKSALKSAAGKTSKAVNTLLNGNKQARNSKALIHPGSTSLSKNTFPKNSKDLLPDLPRDRKGHIYAADNLRIRPEQHAFKSGDTFNPRHHNPHYHVEYCRNPVDGWEVYKNIEIIKPPGYIPNTNHGTGFLPGETFPGM